MEEGQSERKLYATFERHDEFVALQNSLLRSCDEDSSLDSREQWDLVRKLSLIVREHLFCCLQALTLRVARFIPRTSLSTRPIPRKLGDSRHGAA